ncbi:hypothetical protein E4T42_00114 [Aureobasidium subglaciale]|nr:hypothetical protein E4T42_00114 [Aureobasidium subglaciale]
MTLLEVNEDFEGYTHIRVRLEGSGPMHDPHHYSSQERLDADSDDDTQKISDTESCKESDEVVEIPRSRDIDLTNRESIKDFRQPEQATQDDNTKSDPEASVDASGTTHAQKQTTENLKEKLASTQDYIRQIFTPNSEPVSKPLRIFLEFMFLTIFGWILFAESPSEKCACAPEVRTEIVTKWCDMPPVSGPTVTVTATIREPTIFLTTTTLAPWPTKTKTVVASETDRWHMLLVPFSAEDLAEITREYLD